jgi:hypothetical protein
VAELRELGLYDPFAAYEASRVAGHEGKR